MHAQQQEQQPKAVTVPRVTLYVKDSDGPIWDRARALVADSDESLSAMVTEGLAEVVERRERQKKAEYAHDAQMDTVTLKGVNWGHDDQPRNLRFVGVVVSEHDGLTAYITRGRGVVLERYIGGPSNELITFETFEEFREWASEEVGGSYRPEPAMVTEVAEALGEEYFEEIE